MYSDKARFPFLYKLKSRRVFLAMYIHQDVFPNKKRVDDEKKKDRNGGENFQGVQVIRY